MLALGVHWSASVRQGWGRNERLRSMHLLQSQLFLSSTVNLNHYFSYCSHVIGPSLTKVRVPEAGELDVVALRLSLLSHQHPVQVPAAARAFPIMSDSHSPHLPHGHRLDGKLVGLWERKDSEVV